MPEDRPKDPGEDAEENPVAPVEPKELIERLLRIQLPGKGLTQVVKPSEIKYICSKARELFLAQPPLIEIDPPVRWHQTTMISSSNLGWICGDIHGQYPDLIRLFGKGGFPPTNYLFLGDYVDRGKQNIETILILFGYKLAYPKNVFLLRGNHECATINRVYGFAEECFRRYGSLNVWTLFQDVFCCMPYAAVVGERILCMHGGLSPKLESLQQLRDIKRPQDEPLKGSLELDILWSDPVAGIANPRGASYGFGEAALISTCDKLGIDLVARAHQVVQDGYEFFAGRRLVTLFSAPHYCGQFDNSAAVMVVDANMRCSFEILRPKFNKVVPVKK